MASELDDVLELFDHVWNRFWQRMDGLHDEEWQWTPAADARIGLRWRLGHIRRLLSQDRHAELLGGQPEPTGVAQRKAANAASALADLLIAYTWWRMLLVSADETSMAEHLGAAAGPYGEATRRSFVLHVADELIHHCAEAALLRDLFPGAHPAG